MLLHKGRIDYEYIVLTLRVENYEDFITVFKNKSELDTYINDNSSFIHKLRNYPTGSTYYNNKSQ